MAVSASIVGGAALAGTGAQIWAGSNASSSAKRAAQAAAEEARQNRTAAVGFLEPYRNAGGLALSPLTGLLTGNSYDPFTKQTTALSPEQRDNLMYQSPGYRFAIQQGEQGLERSQTARGLSLSGGAQKELAGYLSGAASQYSDNYINQLSQLAGMGQNAATASGNFQIGAGSQVANYAQQAGMAGAYGQANTGNAITGLANSVGSFGGLMAGSKTPSTGLAPSGAQNATLNSNYSLSNPYQDSVNSTNWGH